MDYREYRKKYGSQAAKQKNGEQKPVYTDRKSPDYSRPEIYEADAGTSTRNIDRSFSKNNKNRQGKKNPNAGVFIALIIALAVILALLTVFLIIIGPKYVTPTFLATKVTAEAGRSSISASDFLVDKSVEAEFAEGNKYSLNHVGEYPIRITVKGKTYSTLLVIRDTVAPTAEAEPASVRVGGEIEPSLCLKNIADATDLEFAFKTEPDFSKKGVQNVVIVITDEGGNVTEVASTVTVIGTGDLLVSGRTVECGSTIPDVSAFIGADADGNYVTDISSIRTDVPGTYILEVRCEDKVHQVTLTVRDTVAPTAVVTPVPLHRNASVPEDASIFLSDIRDVTKVTVSYDPVPVNDGNFPIPVRIKLTDTSGNTTYYESYFEEISDFEPPVITVLKSSVSYTIGDPDLIWRDAVSATDDSGGNVTFSASAPKRIVNGEAVEGDNYKTTAGRYVFTVTAEDPYGNSSSVELELYVREISFTDEEFRAAVEAFTARMIKPSMTLMQKLEALYKYLSANSWSQIHYTNDAQHDDWMKEAYSVITKIPNQAKTDCFGFAAVAKAAIESFGCETIMVERNPHSEAGTHFWLVVNIGTKEKPKWYHFDGTPMRGDFKIPAYALTDYQLEAYTKWRDDKLTPAPHYYTFDRTIYDYTPSTEIILQTPQIPSKYYNN